MRDYSEEGAARVLLLRGLPEMTAEEKAGDQLGYQNRLQEWEAAREADRRLLEAHRQSPVVQEALRGLSRKRLPRPEFKRGTKLENFRRARQKWELSQEAWRAFRPPDETSGGNF